LARPILRPAWSRRYLFKFQHGLGHRRILHQSKELVIGGASHLFKNSRTQQVATEIDLTGKLASPGVSTWQAFMQVLHNAFIEAILPGFDRAVRPNTITKTSGQDALSTRLLSVMDSRRCADSAYFRRFPILFAD
jgi:hypothetical protein